jgi:hypothetical protein
MSIMSRSADFVRNMTEAAEDDIPPPTPIPPVREVRKEEQPLPRSISTRANLKHIGGYVDAETVEKVALLRVRLKLDNSQLIKRAIDDLFAKHKAKRAFGDA